MRIPRNRPILSSAARYFIKTSGNFKGAIRPVEKKSALQTCVSGLSSAMISSNRSPKVKTSFTVFSFGLFWRDRSSSACVQTPPQNIPLLRPLKLEECSFHVDSVETAVPCSGWIGHRYDLPCANDFRQRSPGSPQGILEFHEVFLPGYCPKCKLRRHTHATDG